MYRHFQFLLAAFLLFLPSASRAASTVQASMVGPLSVLPGSSFQLTVSINASNQDIDTVRLLGSYDIRYFELIGYTLDGDFPSLSPGSGIQKESGNFSIGAYTINQGFSGVSRVATLTFQAKKEGTGSIKLLSNSTAYSHGNALNISSVERKISISAQAVNKNVPPEETPSASFILSSATHPDQNSWYPSRNVDLAWTVEGPAVRKSFFSVNLLANSVPSEAVEGLSRSFTLDSDGIWFAHVKVLLEDGSTLLRSYRILADIGKPLAPVPVPDQELVPVGVENTLHFGSVDETSGIVRYEVRLGGNVISTTATSMLLPALAPGTHIITVTAFDRAGNTNVNTTTINVLSSAKSPMPLQALMPTWLMLILFFLWVIYFGLLAEWGTMRRSSVRPVTKRARRKK